MGFGFIVRYFTNFVCLFFTGENCRAINCQADTRPAARTAWQPKSARGPAEEGGSAKGSAGEGVCVGPR